MSDYRRANIKGGTYFFTGVTYRRQKILCNKNVRSALRDAIKETREKHPFIIDGWVLLADHLHCIWTLPPDDDNYGIRWAMIKRFVSKQCALDLRRDELLNASKTKRGESTLWQRRFWEHQIRNDKDYENHMNYLHYNPVRHNVVKNVKDWPHSTFHRYVRDGVYDESWGSNGIEIDGLAFGE